MKVNSRLSPVGATEAASFTPADLQRIIGMRMMSLK